MFGQLGFFHRFAGKEYEDKRPRDRYLAETKRLLGVLDDRLATRAYMMGEDYSMVDIALLGWVRNLIGFYEAREITEYDSLKHVPAWLDRCLERPAVQRGVTIPARA
jgi:GSH-dependent disulfide-bond oxidoreductase